jgi:DNA-binding MarR family transcriptional regulator
MDKHYKDKVNVLLLVRISKIIKEQYRQKIEEHEVLHGHGMILHALKDKGRMSQVQLSRYLNVKPASVCTLLQNMQKEGLITREADTHDERVMLTSLTEKGLLKSEEVDKAWKEIDAEYRELFSEEEYITLRNLCFRILEKYEHIEV